MKKLLKVLFVDDHFDDFEKTSRQLIDFFELQAICVNNVPDLIKAFNDFHPDVVLSDYTLLEISAMDVIRLCREKQPDTPVLIITSSQDEETAVDCLRAGAADYLLKDKLLRLPHAIEDAIEHYTLRAEKEKIFNKLSISESNYRKLIGEMIQGIAVHEIILDEHGKAVDYRFLEMNKSFEKLTGLKIQECIGKTVLQVLPQTEDYWIQKYGDVALTGKPIQFEQYSQSLDKFFEVVAYAPSHGKFATIFTDVTEKVLINEKIKEDENKYRMLAENTTDVLFTADLNLNITFISPSIQQLNGYTVEETKKQVFWDIVTEESAAKLKKIFIEELTKEQSGQADPNQIVNIEFEEYHKNGHLITIESTMRFLRDSNEKPIGIIGVSRNITERKRNEIRAQRRSKILKDINHLSVDLNQSMPENLFPFICGRLSEIFDARAVIYNQFDQEQMEFTMQSFSGRLTKSNVMQKLLQKLIYKRKIKIDENTLNQILRDKKLGVSVSLPEVSYHNISPMEAKTVEKLIGRNKYVGIPIIIGEQLLGSFILIIDVADDFLFDDEIIAFSTLVSSIMESKEKADMVLKSEHMYRTLINNAHDIIIVTRNNQILFANDRTLRFSGMTHDQVKETNYLSLIHPDDVDNINKAYEDLRNTGMFKSMQLRMVLNQTTKWLSISAIPIEFEGEKANLTFGTDITDQKLKESELEQELELRSLLYEVSNDGIAILDDHMQIFSVNDKFAEMLGYQKNELLQKSIFNFDISKDEARIRAIMSDALTHKNVFETRYQRKDASEFDVEISARDFNFKQKKYIVCICRDITEHKSASLELREYAENLENAQNIANMGSWQYLYKSNEMTWSKNMYRLLHLNPKKMQASNEIFLNMVHPEDLEELTTSIESARKTGESLHAEFRMILNDQSVIWLSTNLIPIKENDEVIGFKGTSIDITSQKKIQNQLSESQHQIKAIFEHAPVGILSYNNRGIITECNSYICNILGTNIEQLMGFDISQIPNQDVLSAFKKSLQGETVDWEGNYESFLSGKKSHLRLVTTPMNNLEGHYTGGVAIIEEISQRLIAEKKISESQAQFTSSFNYSPVAMVISRFKDGSFIAVNDAWCRLTGYTREFIMNKSIADVDLIDERQLHYVTSYLSSHDKIKEASIQIKNRKGELISIIASLVSYVMNGEKLVLTTMVDISERISYEKELLKLTRAIEQLPVSVVITDVSGTIEYVNPRAVETTGYDAKDLIGQNPRVLKSGEMSRENYSQMYQQLLAGNVWKGEFHNKRKDGSLYWEAATIAPATDDLGEISHFIAIKEDITSKKAMQSALAESERRYKEIFLNNPIPMWIYEVDSLRFIEVNKKATEDYGYSVDEFLSMTLIDIRPEEDIPLLLEDLKKRTDNVQLATQFRHRFKDGTIVDVEITSYAIPSIDNKKMRMVIANNITERIKARKALEEARAVAEASDKLKTNFLNNISHEVRTPLNGIMGATTLLNDPDLDKSEIPELMEIVNLSTTRLIQTITDFMDISLITSNNIEVNKKPTKLSDILEKFRHEYNQECLNKGLSFSIHYTTEAGNLYHELDPELMIKSIRHLLSNAVKFTHKGNVEFGLEVTDQQLTFYVSDTGVGIAKENIPLVFENFRQEDDSSSRRFEGSGLGLSIVKGLTTLQGGTISIESEKGVGTTFYLHFPTRKAVEVSASGVLQSPGVTKEPLILIAEDEESNFIVLSMVMRKSFNSKVLHAFNGAEALTFVKENPEIDLVLMDLKMPIMDGFEATIELKKIRPELPVIAITAFAMSGDEHRALSVGCDHYLAKPVSRRDLQQAMEKFGIYSSDKLDTNPSI